MILPETAPILPGDRSVGRTVSENVKETKYRLIIISTKGSKDMILFHDAMRELGLDHGDLLITDHPNEIFGKPKGNEHIVVVTDDRFYRSDYEDASELKKSFTKDYKGIVKQIDFFTFTDEPSCTEGISGNIPRSIADSHFYAVSFLSFILNKGYSPDSIKTIFPEITFYD